MVAVGSDAKSMGVSFWGDGNVLAGLCEMGPGQRVDDGLAKTNGC